MREIGISRQTDIRLPLTDVVSGCTLEDVARLKDIIGGLGRQTSRRSAELVKDLDELERLRDGYQRFRELLAQIKPKEESLKIGAALLLNVPVRVNPEGDAYAGSGRAESSWETSEPLNIDPAELDLLKYPLWKIVREVVRQVTEIRVFELEAHLKGFGVKASRSAIESALATHPKEFKITKRGREKFVSLKGA